MPRTSAVKCYFGCKTKGPFHHFPKPEYPNMEKFIQWKNILNEDMKEKEDSYIYNNLRICDCHFEHFYRSSSKRLTKNAVPTINLTSTFETVHLPEAVEIKKCIHKQKEDNVQEYLNMSQVEPQKSLHNSPKLNPKVESGTQNCSGEITLLKAEVSKLNEKLMNQKKFMLQAKILSQSNEFLKAIESLPGPIRILKNLQLKKSSMAPRGRRLTAHEKVLYLTIYKQSQNAYNILHKLFHLP